MFSAFRHLPRTSEISSDPVSVVISQITQHEFSILQCPLKICISLFMAPPLLTTPIHVSTGTVLTVVDGTN